MSTEEDPLKPVPQHTKPIDQTTGNKDRFDKPWLRWFIELRTKVNVINALLANFAKLTGIGFPALNGENWNIREMEAGPGINIQNPAGELGNPIFSFDADTGEVASLSGATYNTVQEFINVMISPGIITGGEVTRLNATTVRITGGTGIIRVADDNVSELRFFDFAQQDFAVPDVQVTHFYALDYNGGSPIMIESSGSENWDRDTQIPLGSALRGDGLLNVTANPYRTGDVITNLIQRLDAIGPVQRDNSIGGLVLGVAGTRNVTVSAGRLWARVSDFNITAKNSSVQTMATVFFNGVNLTVTSGITQWDNLNFNNLGTGSLQVMGNNKYANLWFFMSFNGEHYGFAYGTNEYNTLGDAANEDIPSYLTQNFFNQFVLLGRFIFQKSAATPSIIESAFTTLFATSAINNHNDLGGLQVAPDAVVNEYYHLSAAQAAAIAAAINPGGGFVDIASVQIITNNKTFTGSLYIFGNPSGGTITSFDRPGSSSAGSAIQFTSPGGNPGIAIFTGTTSQISIRGMPNLLQLGASSSSSAPTSFVNISPTAVYSSPPVVLDLGTSANPWGNVYFGQGTYRTGVVTPPIIGSNVDNWVVTGLATASFIRASTNGAHSVSGLANPANGQMVRLINVGTQTLTLLHDTTSTAANRFLLPNNASLVLNPNDGVSLWYDNASSRWRGLGI